MLLTNSQPPSPSSSSTHERVQLLYGIENIAKVQSQVVYNAKARIDVCVDSKSPSIVIEGEHVKNILLDAITNRGIKYRYITEINQSNIQYCKKLSKIIHEIRHLNGIRGNFAVTESEYIATVTIQEAQPVSQVIYSNVRSTVEQHQYLFETLWNSSTPAEKRIKEVEEGIDLGKTEIFQNPVKILESFINIIKSAKQEILLIFPTINAFLREERVGIIELLKQSATKHNVNVRIITPTNDYIEKQIQNISIAVRNEQKEGGGGGGEDQEKNNKEKGFFKVQRSNIQFEGTAVTTVTIIVVDKKESLIIEKTDDSKDDFMEAVGLATYSNSKPTVMSYVSIFEGLWRQAESYEELKVHEKMQKEFINIAAHELRTPAQCILGYAELAQEFPLESLKGGEVLMSIYNNAKRLQRLVEDILDVTRIESQTFKIRKEKVNLNEKMRNAINDLKAQIHNAHKVKIVFLEPKQPIYVNADKVRIYQVISNLLNNAIKFTEDGAISIDMDIKDKHEVVISIKDTGTGINPEIMARLFTKFATKSDTGTGLGLFISKAIIEGHSGKIWAENNPDGKGATFAFSIPLNA